MADTEKAWNLAHELLKTLDLLPGEVAELNIRPWEIEVLYYLEKGDGERYIDPATGEMAVTRIRFPKQAQ